MTIIPADAEHVTLFDVLKLKETPSRFCPTIKANRLILVCPACAAEHPATIGVTTHCGCGLSIHYDHSGVDIWREADRIDCQRERA